MRPFEDDIQGVPFLMKTVQRFLRNTIKYVSQTCTLTHLENTVKEFPEKNFSATILRLPDRSINAAKNVSFYDILNFVVLRTYVLTCVT